MHEIILICHEIEYLNDQTKMFNYLFLSKSEKDFKNKHYMIQKIKRAESLSKQIVICSHALKMLTMDNIFLKKLIFLYNFC